ncbi:MAG: enoyl-CoA hydratase/isomerase family protein [Actinomycetota bacterium]
MSLVEVSRHGPVALVELNRPPVNALSAELSSALLDAFRECGDRDVRAVVVTGKPHFAAGADISGFQAAYQSGTDDTLASALTEAIWALERLDKPTIAAVRGFALGGGLELALGADFRYLATDAQVGQPEIKLGLIPGAGGTQRLPRIVGYQAAKEMVYSGRHVDSDEAAGLGLADRVLGPEELIDAAMADATEWAEGPTLALAAAKRALNEGWGQPMTRAMEIEAVEFDRAFRTEDAREGVAAFLDKRRPGFSGR